MKKTLVMLALVASCSGDEPDVVLESARCEQLREHLIGLRLADAPPAVDKDAHRGAMRQALGEAFMSSCAQMSASNLSCALAATDTQSSMACSSTVRQSP